MKLTSRPWTVCLLAAGILAVLIAADQAVKILVEANIPENGVVPLIPGVIGLTFCKNTGAAFSFLSDSYWLLLVLRIVMSIGVAFGLARYYRRMSRPLRLGLFLVLGGAIGNLIDQVLLGYVRDMFEFYFVKFAIFNVADIYITVGVTLVALCLLFPRRPQAPADEEEAAAR